MSQINVKTQSGFEIVLDEDVADNQELLENLIGIEENPENYIKGIGILLGNDGKTRLYEHLRNEKGIVPASAVAKEVAEIFTLISVESKKIKN